MDNCGFHHARFVEPILRNMLADCGITLLFQPPYSPDFNTCEFCFRQIKDYLRRYQLLAEHGTKIAIAEAILQISPENSFSYFRHCGYVASFNCLHQLICSNKQFTVNMPYFVSRKYIFFGIADRLCFAILYNNFLELLNLQNQTNCALCNPT